MKRFVQLIDPSRTVLATARVTDAGDHFGGQIDLRATPAPLRSLFDEFEGIVNGQLFAFLDEIQGRIESLPVKAIFEDGVEVCVHDLQVFPSTGDISFRIPGPGA